MLHKIPSSSCLETTGRMPDIWKHFPASLARNHQILDNSSIPFSQSSSDTNSSSSSLFQVSFFLSECQDLQRANASLVDSTTPLQIPHRTATLAVHHWSPWPPLQLTYPATCLWFASSALVAQAQAAIAQDASTQHRNLLDTQYPAPGGSFFPQKAMGFYHSK